MAQLRLLLWALTFPTKLLSFCFPLLHRSFIVRGESTRKQREGMMTGPNNEGDKTDGNIAIPREPRHKSQNVSVGAFAATAVMLPITSVTVLPISLAFQAGKYIWTSMTYWGGSSSSKNNVTLSGNNVDTGSTVDPSQIKLRVDRTYDIVLLGATGFTGSLAARYLAKQYSGRVKWALAGRSQVKLDEVKSKLAAELGDDNIRNIPTIIVDTADPSTLPRLVADTRVVATTVGPYSLYGSNVVEFCAKYGTHYVDITGEVDWVRSMVAAWQSKAQETGARLIPFCGHDSVPWDLLVMKLQQILQEEFRDDLVSATFWDDFRGAAPGGSFATVLAGVDGKLARAPKLDTDPLMKLPNGQKSDYKVKTNLPGFIGPSKSPWDLHAGNGAGRRWTVPFLMAMINSRVVQWSYALRQTGTKSLTYSEVQVVPNFRTAFCFFFQQFIGGIALLNPITRGLLKRYVIPKPGSGPSMEAMEVKHFLYITGEGIGKAGNRAQVALYFKKDVSCLETARMMVEAGLCLAQTKEEDLKVGGGFWPPAVGLGDTLFHRILDENTRYASKAFPRQELMSKL